MASWRRLLHNSSVSGAAQDKQQQDLYWEPGDRAMQAKQQQDKAGNPPVVLEAALQTAF